MSNNVTVIPVANTYKKCQRYVDQTHVCTSRGVYSPVLEFEDGEFLIMHLCFTHYRDVEHLVVFEPLNEDHR